MTCSLCWRMPPAARHSRCVRHACARVCVSACTWGEAKHDATLGAGARLPPSALGWAMAKFSNLADALTHSPSGSVWPACYPSRHAACGACALVPGSNTSCLSVQSSPACMLCMPMRPQDTTLHCLAPHGTFTPFPLCEPHLRHTCGWPLVYVCVHEAQTLLMPCHANPKPALNLLLTSAPRAGPQRAALRGSYTGSQGRPRKGAVLGTTQRARARAGGRAGPARTGAGAEAAKGGTHAWTLP